MKRWLPVLTSGLVGMAAGVGLYTFGYAKGYSYFSNNPAACANCHIMDEHFAAWLGQLALDDREAPDTKPELLPPPPQTVSPPEQVRGRQDAGVPPAQAVDGAR